MRCPFCFQMGTRVIDSRFVGEGNQIRRRRECSQCSKRFTSYETAELNYPHIIKSDGRCEIFNEEKLRSSVLRALEKRPVGMDNIEIVIAHVQKKLRTQGRREISSHTVGNWVMEQLKVLDRVAYLRFASVCQSFEDVEAFRDEIEKLENELPPQIKESQLNLLPSDGEG